MEGVQLLKSCEMKDTRYKRKVFSESAALSIEAANTFFPALVLQDRTRIPTLSSAQLEKTLYVCASFQEIGYSPIGKVAKRASWKLQRGVEELDMRSRF